MDPQTSTETVVLGSGSSSSDLDDVIDNTACQSNSNDMSQEAPSEASSISYCKRFTISLGDREVAIRAILAPGHGDHEDSIHDISSSSLPANEVREQWAHYLMSSVPEKDWLAVWLPNALDRNTETEASDGRTCVDVVEVQHHLLTATIIVLQSEENGDAETKETDGKEEAEEEKEFKLSVSLLELFPILDADNLETCQMASSALDHCRFFYKFIWRPWDLDDDSDDWLGEHLSFRFELYQEFQQIGALSHSWTRLENLALQYGALQEELNYLRNENVAENGETDSLRVDLASFFEIEAKLEEIRKTAFTFENRTLLMQLNLRAQDKRREGRPLGKACLVVVPSPGSIKSISKYLEQVEAALEGVGIATSYARIFQHLGEAIQVAIRDDVIVVPAVAEQRHVVEDLGELSYGGVILGVGEEKGIVICKVKYTPELQEQLQLVNVTLLF